MVVEIIQKPISFTDLQEIAKNQFGDLVKAVVDVEKEVMAIGGELHADEEVLLSENGSKREDMWGINIYPEKFGEDWVEFDSMINIKPHFGNRSRGIDNLKIRERILRIVNKLISR